MKVIAEIYGMPAYRGISDKTDCKETTEPYSVRIVIEGSDDYDGEFAIEISEGFIFDGASIPRLLWRVCGNPWESPRDAAALIHDWLYASKVFPRDIADAIYKALQLAAGISSWKAGIEYYALLLFGGAAWSDHDDADKSSAMNYGRVRRVA